MKTIYADQALTEIGWLSSVKIEVSDEGRIESISDGVDLVGDHGKILIPAPSNLHSHGFQRAMAGMTESRGHNSNDSFWTWRALMYQFLDHLTPDDIEAITLFAQMEMLEAGFAGVAEFHYLHHQPDGTPYDDIGEISGRIVAAASESGIGLCLLPVLYQQGGADGRPLERGQRRFGASIDDYQKIADRASAAVRECSADLGVGVAAHSLRAVRRENLNPLQSLIPDRPVHIHIAEQVAEVEEIKALWGKPPVEWLLDNLSVDGRWCLVHATHMLPHETLALANSGAVAGLCPITECNLGDGIFNGAAFFENQGVFGVGTDSNVLISLAEELRLLEYSQRLRDQARAILATADASTGRVLLEQAAMGGAQACGRKSGVIKVGHWADFIALDAEAIDIEGKKGDAILDAFIFSGGERSIVDVWSAGRHMVKEGRHIKRDAITARYRSTIDALRAKL